MTINAPSIQGEAIRTETIPVKIPSAREYTTAQIHQNVGQGTPIPTPNASENESTSSDEELSPETTSNKPSHTCISQQKIQDLQKKVSSQLSSQSEIVFDKIDNLTDLVITKTESISASIICVLESQDATTESLRDEIYRYQIPKECN